MQKTTAQRKIIENVIIEKSAGLNQKIYAIAAGKSVNPQSSIRKPIGLSDGLIISWCLDGGEKVKSYLNPS
jgi:hypothetical protein